MIKITRLNGRMTVVNAELIGTVEATPDTMMTLTSGQKLAVLESVDQVIELVHEYRRQVRLGPRVIGSSAAGSSLPNPPDAHPPPLDPAVAIAGDDEA